MFLDKITIGSSIESLLYAFLNDNYFLPTENSTPIFYKKMSKRILPLERQDYNWSRLMTSMSLLGKLLNYEDLYSVRIRNDQIKFIHPRGPHRYHYGVCNIFDTTKVQTDSQIKIKKDSMYTIYDDFELSNLGAKHPYLQSFLSSQDLAKEIHYYISNRVDGANYVTDCVVESFLNKEQINDINYSDSIVRFAVIRHLEAIGIRGNFMNFYKNGAPKYRKPKVKHKKRIVIEKEMNIYQDTDKLKFLNFSMKEILNESTAQRP